MEAIELNSVEDLKNCGPGTYMVPYGRFRFKVIIGNIDQNANINLDGYGIGRVKDDAIISSYIEQNPNDNTVNIIMGYADGRNGYDAPQWRENATNFMKDVSNTLNLKTDNSLLIGFSNSAERTVPFAADYAANNNASHFPVVIVESSCSPPTKLSDTQRQSLIDHDVTIFNVYQAHKQTRSLTNPLHLQNFEGVHIVDVEVSINNGNGGDLHTLPYDVLVSSGGLNLGNGNYDFSSLPSQYTMARKSSPYYNQTFDLRYRFIEHYLDENGNYVSREITKEEATALANSNVIPTYTNPLSMNDGFVIQQKDSPVKIKYAGFKNISTDTTISSKSGRTLSSDYGFVSDTMNNLKAQIKASSFVDTIQNFGFRSDSGIAGIIQGYINTYFDIVGSLMNSLSMEADAVISYGQAYVDMEDDMKKGVQNIGEIVETDNSSKYIGIGFNLPTSTEQTETVETTATTATTPTTDTTSSTTGTTSYTGTSSYTGSTGYTGYTGSTGSTGGSSSGSSSTTSTTATTAPSDGIIEVIPTTPTQAITPVVEPQPVPYTPPAYYSSPAVVEQTPVVATTGVEDMAPTDIVLDSLEEGTTEIAGMPETTEGPRIPSVTTVPNSTIPIEPSTTGGKKGNAILPVVAGLSVAAAAGLGAKAYLDHKKNNETEEEDSFEYQYDYEDEDVIHPFQYKEASDPEFQDLEEEKYTTRNTDDLVGI